MSVMPDAIDFDGGGRGGKTARLALAAGAVLKCRHCHQSHVVEQPYRDRRTAERLHLYVTCGKHQYFVGIATDV